MKIRLNEKLPFVEATLVYHGQTLLLQNVILDTGSAGTIIATDRVIPIGIQYEDGDGVHRIRGVGGGEWVYSKRVEQVSVGQLSVTDFEVEIGAMNYGFDIDGIISMDFLIAVGAIIDLKQLEIL